MDQFELARENLSYLLDKVIEHTELKPDIDITINSLASVSNEDSNIKAEWDEFCTANGITYNQFVSAEALVSNKDGNTSLTTRLFSEFSDAVDAVGTLFNMFSGYRKDKLEELLGKIKSGELVKKDKVGLVEQERLFSKYASFAALGHSLSNVKDLIEYMKDPVDGLLDGKYDKLFHTFLNTKAADVSDLRKVSPNIDFSKIKFSIKLEKENYNKVLMSFLIKRFYSKLYMYSFVFAPNSAGTENKSVLSVNGIAGANIDIVKIPTNIIGELKPYSVNDMISLLEFGIKENDNIVKAIKKSKGLFLSYGTKATIATVVANFASIGGAYKVIFGRTFDAIINHIGNACKDMIHYDDQIIQLVNMMYEKK